MPGFAKVLGAPLSNSKKKALKFTPNLEKYSKLDRATIQNIVKWTLILKQVGLNICIIIPIILDKQTAGLLLAAYTGLVLLVEAFIVLLSFTVISVSIFNFFLYVQLLCGILKKASLLALALLLGICIQSKGLIGVVVGVIAIISILSEQFLIARQVKQERKTDPDAVLPNIEST